MSSIASDPILSTGSVPVCIQNIACPRFQGSCVAKSWTTGIQGSESRCFGRWEIKFSDERKVTNEQGKIQADIKQMKIWMDGDRRESKITAFASEAMRFTERADDY